LQFDICLGNFVALCFNAFRFFLYCSAHCVERQDEDNMVEDVVRGEEEDGETTSNSVMTKLLVS